MKLNQAIKLILAWIILGLVSYLVYYLSSQIGSDTFKLSHQISTWIGDLIYNSPTAAQINEINKIIRKYAHFVVYFVLAIVFFSTLLYTFQLLLRGKIKLIYINMFIIISLSGVAFYDEWRKQFILGRHTSYSEALINVCGIVAGILLVNIVNYLYYRLKRRLFRK